MIQCRRLLQLHGTSKSPSPVIGESVFIHCDHRLVQVTGAADEAVMTPVVILVVVPESENKNKIIER